MSNCIPENAEWFLDEFDAERFWKRVNFRGGTEYEVDPIVRLDRVSGECWTWLGKDNGDPERPYGRFDLYGKRTPAHRVAYRDFGNKVTDEEVVDHLCRNTLCVNPAHLEAVTHAENIRRGHIPLNERDHCKNDHEVTPDSIVARGNGALCRVCLNETKRRSYLRRKAAGKA